MRRQTADRRVGPLRRNWREMTPTDPAHENGSLDPETVAELQRLAHSRPKSGRGATAKASAIRTLERLSRARRRQERPPMPPDWYPHSPDSPWYELDWTFLHKHPHILERHWEEAWREGRV
jgi:hypothetical protein